MLARSSLTSKDYSSGLQLWVEDGFLVSIPILSVSCKPQLLAIVAFPAKPQGWSFLPSREKNTLYRYHTAKEYICILNPIEKCNTSKELETKKSTLGNAAIFGGASTTSPNLISSRIGKSWLSSVLPFLCFFLLSSKNLCK